MNTPWTEPRRVPDVGVVAVFRGSARVEMPGFARERTPFRGALVFSVPPRPLASWKNFIVSRFLWMRLGENGTVAGSWLSLVALFDRRSILCQQRWTGTDLELLFRGGRVRNYWKAWAFAARS